MLTCCTELTEDAEYQLSEGQIEKEKEKREK